MADELEVAMPEQWNWQKLKSKSGSDLRKYYEELLAALGSEPGMLGQMFLQAKNHINTPSRLSGLIDMIGRETWSGLNTDLKGNIYEELLAKTAEDKKSGAGRIPTDAGASSLTRRSSRARARTSTSNGSKKSPTAWRTSPSMS